MGCASSHSDKPMGYYGSVTNCHTLLCLKHTDKPYRTTFRDDLCRLAIAKESLKKLKSNNILSDYEKDNLQQCKHGNDGQWEILLSMMDNPCKDSPSKK